MRPSLWRPRSCTLVALLVALASMLLQASDAWPYVDCAGPNPIFSLQQVVAHYDRSNNSIGLLLQGNFTDTYWAQGYSEAATSQWRTSIQTTIMGTQLYRSEGPACMQGGGMIVGGCPTAPGFGVIQTSFNNVSQAAPFAELMVAMQIIGSNNQSIVCVAVLLEQTMTEVNTAISLLPLALALFSGAISLVATILRASIGSGFLGAVASYGLPTEAVSVHTPGLFDIIFYTQFMVMTGQLSLNYPSFYSTFTALFHWSFLQFKDTLIGKGPANATEVLTYQGAGSVNQMRAQIYVPGNRSKFASHSAGSTASSIGVLKRSILTDMEQRVGHAPLPAIGTAQAAALLASTTLTPTPAAAAQLKRRQEPFSETLTPFSPSPSPSPTTAPSPSEPAFTSSTKSSFTTSTSSSSSSSSSSRSRSTGGRPTPPPSRTPPLSPTASTEAPALIIPTITDPFTNTSAGTEQHNVSRFGIESYIAAISASPSTLFLGTLINAALAAAGTLVLSAMLLAMAWIKAKENHQKGKTLQHAFNFVAGNLIRLWSLLYTPLALTAMYQLTISGGAALTTGAAAALLIFSVGATVFFTWRVLRASSDLLLFDDLGTLLKYGTLYNTLSQEGTLFFLVTLLARFLWGLAVTMLSSFGVAQVAVLLVVEFGYMLVIAIKWPFSQSGDNKFHLFLSILRIVITGCSIAYIHSLEASPELRQLFAYIQMALHLAVFIVTFALSLWNLIQVCIFWKTRHSDSWKGPTKTYNFEDPIDGSEQGWGLGGRPLSSGGGSHTRGVRYGGEDDDDSGFGLVKTRRFTVQSYSSLGSSGHSARGASMRHTMHGSAPPHLMLQQPPLEGSDDDLSRFGSPAERYRQSRLTDHRRSRLAESDAAVSPTEESLLERRLDALTTLSASAAPAAGTNRLVTPSPSTLPETSSDTEASTKANPRLSMANTVRSALPQRESYANLQRLSHQQAAPDPRTRRMSDITRDGPYLYNPRKDEKESASQAVVADRTEPTQSLWSSMKASIGNAFGRFGKRSAGSPSTDGSKPKAFEVMRPPRRTYEGSERPASRTGSVAVNDETGSQVGGDRLRELNTLGISRFFQESDRGYERNRNLFVANPSAMISRTGSLVSTVSGAVGPSAAAPSIRLNRNGSGTAESIRTLQQARSRGPMAGTGSVHTLAGMGAGVGVGDRASLLVGGGGGGGGIDSPRSEHTGSASISDRDSRRTSSALMIGTGSGSVSQLYPPRHSVESSNNIADALSIEAPLLLQGGGILKVSKGPEKAVQYWHKDSGQYAELSAEALRDQQSPQQRKALATTAGGEMGGAGTMLEGSHSPSPKQPLPPTIRTQRLPQTGSPLSIRTRSMAESSMDSGGPSSEANSPTESHSQGQPSPSTNVAASAGRMHEILGRMFSDQSVRLHSDHEQDADSILSEDTASTFSGRYSIIRRRSLLQPRVHTTPHSPNQSPVQTRSSQPHPAEDGTVGLDQGEVTAHSPQQPDDAHSVLGYDMLEPVMEDSDLDEPDLTPRQSTWDPLDAEGSKGVADGIPKVTILEAAGTTVIAPEDAVKRALSASSTMMDKKRADSSLLTRTFSGSQHPSSSSSSSSATAAALALRTGQPRPKQNSLSGRPLQQPAHPSPLIRLGSPQPGQHLVSTASASAPPSALVGAGDLSRQSSVQSGTSSRLDYLDANWLDHNPYDHGEYEDSALNRNASIATVKTEASYVTALSRYPSDDERDEDA